MLNLNPFIQKGGFNILENCQHCAIMFMLWVEMTIINIAIECMFVMFYEKFKLDINPVHNEIIRGIGDSIEYTVWNVSICSFLREINLPGVVFIWCDDYVHFFTCCLD